MIMIFFFLFVFLFVFLFYVIFFVFLIVFFCFPSALAGLQREFQKLRLSSALLHHLFWGVLPLRQSSSVLSFISCFTTVILVYILHYTASFLPSSQ